MKTRTNYRRTAKIVRRYYDTAFNMKMTDGECDPTELDKMPVYLEVSIRVRVLGLWLTVWEESCRLDDKQSCDYLETCAAEVLEKLQEQI